MYKYIALTSFHSFRVYLMAIAIPHKLNYHVIYTQACVVARPERFELRSISRDMLMDVEAHKGE